MKQFFCLLIAASGFLAANAQLPGYDPYPVKPRAQVPELTPTNPQTRPIDTAHFIRLLPVTAFDCRHALYFQKGPYGSVQRLTLSNLQLAMADNPASTNQLHIARTNINIGIGLLAGGLALTTAGIIATVNRNNSAQNAFKAASASWFAAAQRNPNTPMPTLPHYGASPLLFIGPLTMLTAIIPFSNVNNHAQKALNIYNGVE